MSLSIYLNVDLYDQYGRLYEEKSVFDTNITHNLGKMAQECGLYGVMWRPEEFDGELNRSRDYVRPLIAGVQQLVDQQHDLEKLNPENGWGNYDNLLDTALEFLTACLKHPEAKVVHCR